MFEFEQRVPSLNVALFMSRAKLANRWTEMRATGTLSVRFIAAFGSIFGDQAWSLQPSSRPDWQNGNCLIAGCGSFFTSQGIYAPSGCNGIEVAVA